MTTSFLSRDCITVNTLLSLMVAFGIETGVASVAGVFAASNMFSKAVAFMESGANQEAAQVYDDIIRQSRFSRDIHKALYLKLIFYSS